jgi:hypothetical protein
MRLGWKILIPISLAWILLVATVRAVGRETTFSRTTLLVAAAIVLVIAVISLFLPQKPKPDQTEVPDGEEFDAFAGGYPVPPMPGQELPELAGVLAGATEEGTNTPGGRGGVDPPGVNTAPMQSASATSPTEGNPTSTGAAT